MPVDGSFLTFEKINGAFLAKAFLLLFLVFLSVFALIMLRQIQLMNKKLPTPLSPILQFVGILYVGIVLAILFLIAGSF